MSELVDNRSHRIRTLKEIVQHLHAGNPPELERVKRRPDQYHRQWPQTRRQRLSFPYPSEVVKSFSRRRLLSPTRWVHRFRAPASRSPLH